MATQVERLRQYNRWRRGDDNLPQPEPKELGELLDGIADRLEVLEREHSEFFEKWHDERRKREKWQQVIVAAVELVCAPAWAGVSDEDVKLEHALRDAGLVTHNAVGQQEAACGRSAAPEC